MQYFPIIATILRIYSLVHICNSERDVAVIKAFFLFSAIEICSAILQMLGWKPNNIASLLQTSDQFTYAQYSFYAYEKSARIYQYFYLESDQRTYNKNSLISAFRDPNYLYVWVVNMKACINH
jgi:hypothetical protein